MATILITGASRGIGESIARCLAGEGHRLVLAARSTDRLTAIATELQAEWLELELSDQSAVAAAADRTRGLFDGPPDVLVNCAGVFDVAPLVEATSDSLDRNLDINLRGPFLMIRSFLGGMLERGSGLVVNIGSVAGRQAFPGNGAYSASKFGLRGLHEVLLEEIRGSGVRATLVEPGAVDTEIWDPLAPDEDPALPSRSQMLQAVDVAEAVRFVVNRPAHVQIPVLQIGRA